MQSCTDAGVSRPFALIPINDKWRIHADEYQWIVERRKGTVRDKPNWRGIAFFQSLDRAVVHVLSMHVKDGRLSDIPEGFAEAFSTLATKMDEAKRAVVEAVHLHTAAVGTVRPGGAS